MPIPMYDPMLIDTDCPRCGRVSVDPSDVRWAFDAKGSETALCELTCPSCSLTLFVRTTRQAVELMRRSGAQPLQGPAPFELLEPHHGKSFRWQNVLDFHLALAEATSASEVLSC